MKPLTLAEVKREHKAAVKKRDKATENDLINEVNNDLVFSLSSRVSFVRDDLDIVTKVCNKFDDLGYDAVVDEFNRLLIVEVK